MKTRLVIIAILLLMLTVLLSRNDARITDTLLATINPIKQSYTSFTQNLKDKSHSYIFQKESIEKLNRENRILRKRLLEQMHYVEQVKNIYNILPNLSRLPVSSISIVETISYVKLNSFSQIILTKPKGLKEDKLYGIIQNRVVAGIAIVHGKQLYGYLTSDSKCRFSVFVGKTKAPGIALGMERNKMLIKFIPKWHKIKVDDKVYTSGLDNIFFANIPVGIVTKIEVQSSYTVAHIKTYSDNFHPKTFFLINDAKATLSNGFDSSKTRLISHSSVPEHKIEQNVTKVVSKHLIPSISSIPERIDQTQETIIEPEKIDEVPLVPKIKEKKRNKKHQKKVAPLDLF